jgi:hypothetical protein
MICEHCKKTIKKKLEVRWSNLSDYGYYSKHFTSIEKLIEWVEENDKGTVVLKVVTVPTKKANKHADV